MNAPHRPHTARPAAIFIPDEAWTETDYGHGSRLRAEIIINGCSMHLEAYAVDPTRYNRTTQSGEVLLLDDDADRAYGLIQPDSCPTTLEIRGELYALIATPFGR